MAGRTEEFAVRAAGISLRARSAGGSAHGAWAEIRLGFSYAMNDMREDSARSDDLLSALHESASA
jgi:hypothetical protein